jgi:hypothetical protein
MKMNEIFLAWSAVVGLETIYAPFVWLFIASFLVALLDDML